MWTKFDIKIKWNKMLTREIEKKSIKKRIKKQIAIKKIKTKFDIRIKSNQILRDEIEK